LAVGYVRWTETDSAATSETPPAHRLAHVVGAVAVGVVLPAVLMGVLVGALGVAAMFVGLVLGVAGAKIGGTERMVWVAPLIGIAGGLGAFTAYDWWWAALLAATGLLAGAGIRFGWLPSLLMVPYAATFVGPVSSGRNALIYGVVAALGTLYGVVIARRFGAPAVVDGDRVSVPVACGVAVVFAAIMGGAAAIGVGLGWTEPYWVAEPILILVLYILMGKRDRIRGKAIGTSLGVLAALPVALLDPPAGVLAAVGTVAFVVALTQAKNYAVMYGLYTFSLVLLLASPGQVGFEAEERGFQILVGVGLLVVGLFVVHRLARWAERREPETTFAGGPPT
jgi:MFS family permease